MTRNTKISAWTLAAAAIAAQCLAQPILADAAGDATRPIALKAAHLFDSVSGKMVEHGVVVVSGSKILAVGSDAKIADDARVIDLGDATLLTTVRDLRSRRGPPRRKPSRCSSMR